eukprot:gnl/TRDRNA2_/TRDRNA2_190954_c0_seq1.p1 gnl/TRDRNA2_/TRDRNA2_190954_c0~~gnl/TRDRNA2_/TRDRNA2_190954_c0_seq1.p1  ORF type:complete len:187 (+),score=33.09 gnl/TRDRNA2_/TRDRNA2_190954_c0_seq1:94-654(+)
MLIPFPAMPSPSGPPSDYLLRRRPVVIAVLITQTILCALRIALFLDILGGFIMAIVVGVGWYAVKQDMNITFLCYWGIMCFIQGIFGLVTIIDAGVHGAVLWDKEHLVKSIVLLGVPIMYIVGSILAYCFYQDATEEYLPPPAGGGYGALNARGAGGSSGGGGGMFSGPNRSVNLFSGDGHKLGSN